PDRGHVEPAGRGARADALDVLRLLPCGHDLGGDAAEELVAGVDVVDEDADAAVLDVVADAGLGHVEVVVFGGCVQRAEGSSGHDGQGRRQDEAQGRSHGEEPYTIARISRSPELDRPRSLRLYRL